MHGRRDEKIPEVPGGTVNLDLCVQSGFVGDPFAEVNHPETAGVFRDVFAEGGCVASVPDP